MNNIKLLDKIYGCMLGGGIGDALGYPIEFYSYDAIQSHFGKSGLTEFIKDKQTGKALISDDTQMTIFTANALVNCWYNMDIGIASIDTWLKYIEYAYRKWINTQTKSYSSRKGEYYPTNLWVYDKAELWNTRAPGNTCLGSLHMSKLGTTVNRINNSKGCGGVMRVAPVGIVIPRYLLCNRYIGNAPLGFEYIFNVGAETAAITHGHIDGWAPAGMLSVIIAKILYTSDSLSNIIKSSIELTRDICNKYDDYENSSLIHKVTQAYQLALDSTSEDEDESNIRNIGGGWTGDEALAIAIYCSVKYANSFEKAVQSSVNHGGDSDSTGAITGNIVGALLGESGIPLRFKDLECLDILYQLSEDMWVDIDGYKRRYKETKIK